MPRPELSPRALGLSDKLLAKLDPHTPRTTDDLLPWWERHGVLRVELVRLLRQLVEDGQLSKGPEGFLLASDDKHDERKAAPARESKAERAESKAERAERAESRAARSAESSGKTPEPARVEPSVRPASKASEASQGTERAAKEESKAPAKPSESKPAKAAEKPGKSAEEPASKEPPRSGKKGQTPAPAEVEPASSAAPVSTSSTLVARVLDELKRRPQSCADLLTKLPDANPNTVRGALARLKSSGQLRLDDKGVYHLGTAKR